MFTTIGYLKTGNKRQQKCYYQLRSIRIFELLESYHPILVGTVPLEIDLPGSDLDIICEVYDFVEFQTIIRNFYSNYKDFTERLSTEDYVANFFIDGHEIEIFAEAQPTTKQLGYRHMMIEYRLLQLFDESFRQNIIRLKTVGYKTEPAFAKLLGLVENPYEALLELEKYSDEELLQYLPV